MSELKYLAPSPAELRAQVGRLLAEGGLGEALTRKYPHAHQIRTDRALYDYVTDLRGQWLRKAEPLAKVCFDNQLHVVRQALGTHTAISRVQGGKLKAKREIRVAGLFRAGPPEFLRMIVVHELAHLKEREHDRAFYALCTHMEPNYHQLEFDLRVYLAYLEAGGARLWETSAPPPAGATE